MRKLAATMLALCILLTGTAPASEATDEASAAPAAHAPADRAAVLTAILTERLSLTSDQQSRIREISERHAARVDVALANYKRPALKKELKKISSERDADFQKVLSDEQYAKYQEEKRDILREMKQQVRGDTSPE
jgi:hypothetical protein